MANCSDFKFLNIIFNPIIMDPIEAFVLTIIVGAIVIALFLLLRNIVLWYYRINDRFVLHDETNQLLTEILKELRTKKE